MLFALTFFLQFLIGGLTGIFVASPVLDYHANNSYMVIAHFHYTLFAGSVFGFFAGSFTGFPRSPARCCANGWASGVPPGVGSRGHHGLSQDLSSRRVRDLSLSLSHL